MSLIILISIPEASIFKHLLRQMKNFVRDRFFLLGPHTVLGSLLRVLKRLSIEYQVYPKTSEIR